MKPELQMNLLLAVVFVLSLLVLSAALVISRLYVDRPTTFPLQMMMASPASAVGTVPTRWPFRPSAAVCAHTANYTGCSSACDLFTAHEFEQQSSLAKSV